jgi:HD-GYP domain-containing protein (c-di-GMP phosphodiesterase class II)
MRRIHLDSARPGLVLGKAILGSSGQVLLNAGVVIKQQYITYLKRLGVEYLYAYDSSMEDVEIKDLISEDTRQKARALLKDIFKNLQSPVLNKQFILPEKKVVQLVSCIIEELLDNKDIVAQLMDIRALDDYLFAHSVNCCVLATLLAANMNYNEDILKDLATGTLLHDIGMVAVPETILRKSGKLTRKEFATVKTHPSFGYEILKKSSLFSERAGTVILQHHERRQGQGYPQGLKGNKINILAQIAGIVDVYDSLTSNRPYRRALQPHQAVEMLMSWGVEHFEIKILREFLANIAAYPLGSQVVLNNGECGLVIENTPGFTLRPVVRILYKGENMAPHPSPYDLDLSQALDLTIVKVLV